jgi:hypothetical protein
MQIFMLQHLRRVAFDSYNYKGSRLELLRHSPALKNEFGKLKILLKRDGITEGMKMTSITVTEKSAGTRKYP